MEKPLHGEKQSLVWVEACESPYIKVYEVFHLNGSTLKLLFVWMKASVSSWKPGRSSICPEAWVHRQHGRSSFICRPSSQRGK